MSFKIFTILVAFVVLVESFPDRSERQFGAASACTDKEYIVYNVLTPCNYAADACATLGADKGYKPLSIRDFGEQLDIANRLGQMMSGHDAWTSGFRISSLNNTECNPKPEAEWVWTSMDNAKIDETLLSLTGFNAQDDENYIYLSFIQNEGVKWFAASESTCRGTTKYTICERCLN